MQTASVATQTLSTTPISVNYEFLPTAQIPPEVISYSKAIQTSEAGSPRRRRSVDGLSHSDPDSSQSPSRSPRKLKRRSRREREREEELRQNLKREIEEELKAAQKQDPNVESTEPKYPARPLTDEELNAVTASEEFLDFVDKSSKVIERALDQDYNVLADYGLEGAAGEESDEDEAYGKASGKKGRRIKQIAQFYDERWSKKRMISDINFSPRVNCISPPLMAMLNQCSVPRAAAGFLYKESFRPCRPCWPTASLESTSTVTTRIYIPFNLRSPYRPVFTISSLIAHRRDLQRTDSPLGYSIAFHASVPKDPSYRRS